MTYITEEVKYSIVEDDFHGFFIVTEKGLNGCGSIRSMHEY